MDANFLMEKYGGLPVLAWAAVSTGGLAVYLIHKKNATANSGQAATSAAAQQANSNLGSASQLANFFEVAGLMPYQGGDVYVNTTQTNNTPVTNTGGWTVTQGPNPPQPNPSPAPGGGNRPPATSPPLVYRVHRGDTLSAIAAKYGLTWQQLYAYNTSTGSKGANRPPSTIATLKRRGPNLIFSNEEIDIPKKGTVYSGGY